MIDMRFVPDDIDFKGREILNECVKAPENYKPQVLFIVNILTVEDRIVRK